MAMGMWERATNPNKARLELHKQKLAAKQEADMMGYKGLMMKEWMERHPDEDLTGTAFEPMQKRYQEKLIQQGGPLYQPVKDEKGKTTGYKEKEGAREKQAAEQEANPMVMTGQGPEYVSGNKFKDHTYREIMKKRALAKERGLDPESVTTNLDRKFMNKFLGLSDSKTVSKKLDEIKKGRAVAKDMAKTKAIEMAVEQEKQLAIEGGGTWSSVEANSIMKEMAQYSPSETEIQANIPEMLDWKWGNRDTAKDEEVKKQYEIKLPEKMTHLGKTLDYLEEEYGIEREEGLQVLQDMGIEIISGQVKE